MLVLPQPLPGVSKLVPDRFADNRGFFFESYNRQRHEEHGFTYDFVQDSVAVSTLAMTVRGLHFQKPPSAHAKLVWVSAGRVFDVVVDIRRGSPSFGKSICTELSAENGAMLLIPVGFAHGYCTLVANTVVQYKTDALYSAEDDCGIAWDDPALGIDWPTTEEAAILSAKDRRLPSLAETPAYFSYHGDRP